jgi:signal transduction histidine kinase
MAETWYRVSVYGLDIREITVERVTPNYLYVIRAPGLEPEREAKSTSYSDAYPSRLEAARALADRTRHAWNVARREVRRREQEHFEAMKILGEAKSYEKSIANDINGRIDHVNFRLGKHHPLFDATINEARDTLLGLMLLAMIPALLTGYLALRGILKMFGEISTNKERIATANQSLESALAELRRVQETMVETERLSTLGRLTATVSHELRNPMAAIRNSLFLIREFAGQPDKVNANVERAERSIVRCDNIIGDLLEYTRYRNLNLQPVSLQFLVRTILEEHRLPAKLKLTTDLRGSEAKVMADLDRFRRVVINLVENAAEAIKVHRGFGEIKVQTGLIGDHAFLEISDDGPGMTEELRGRIFEPLFTTKSFGAGLGLPTAKQLVEQHLGKITVNSEPGVGSSFRVILPLATAQQGRAA